MFRTRFWPMTARPISPMSQLSFCIESFYLSAMRRPLRRALLAKGPNSFGEIGPTKQFRPRRLSGFPGFAPIQRARLGDEAESAAQGLSADGGRRGGDFAGPMVQLHSGRDIMRQAHSRSLFRADGPAGDGELDG